MIFEPLDVISKLASLIPAPRINLTRFHGVFAPNSQYRAGIINRETKHKLPAEVKETESERYGAKNWAMRLKRAFNMDIKTCESCGGAVQVIACVDDPAAIEKILTHLQAHQSSQVIPTSRAPPAISHKEECHKEECHKEECQTSTSI